MPSSTFSAAMSPVYFHMALWYSCIGAILLLKLLVNCCRRRGATHSSDLLSSSAGDAFHRSATAYLRLLTMTVSSYRGITGYVPDSSTSPTMPNEPSSQNYFCVSASSVPTTECRGTVACPYKRGRFWHMLDPVLSITVGVLWLAPIFLTPPVASD